MKVVVQRVKYAKCHINEEIYSEIDKGFMLLVGFEENDVFEDLTKVANKIMKLRIFEDENGKMNLDLLSVNGQILSISQFTLYADVKKGNRPSFIKAKNPKEATILYDKFNKLFIDNGYILKSGIFGADMKIEMINDGPVTIIIDSKEL